MPPRTKNSRNRGSVKNKKKNETSSRKRRRNSNHEIEELTEKINKKWGKYSKLNCTALRYAMSIGKMSHKLKRLVKKQGMGWTDYVKNNFPGLTIRTIQRYMKIYKRTPAKKYPVLKTLGQSVVLTIIDKLEKGQDVASFLDENGIHLEVDMEEEEEIQEFSEKVADLIYVDDGKKGGVNKKKKQKSKKSTESFKIYIDSFITKIEKAKKNQKLIEKISLKEFTRLEKQIKEEMSSLKKLIKASMR